MNYLLVLLIPLAWGQMVTRGRTKVDPNRDDIQKVATMAMSLLNTDLGATHSLTRVVEAYTQIVSGTMYFLKLEIQDQVHTRVCDVEVWSRLWLNDTRIALRHCSAKTRRARHIPGGVQPAQMTPEIQKAVMFAVEQVNLKINSMFRMVLDSVDNLTSQVVDGIKYVFDLLLVTSTCRNNADNIGKGSGVCPVNTNIQTRMVCKIGILSQTWMPTKYQVLSDSCVNI